jgi:hypothetical protein
MSDKFTGKLTTAQKIAAVISTLKGANLPYAQKKDNNRYSPLYVTSGYRVGLVSGGVVVQWQPAHDQHPPSSECLERVAEAERILFGAGFAVHNKGNGLLLVA